MSAVDAWRSERGVRARSPTAESAESAEPSGPRRRRSRRRAASFGWARSPDIASEPPTIRCIRGQDGGTTYAGGKKLAVGDVHRSAKLRRGHRRARAHQTPSLVSRLVDSDGRGAGSPYSRWAHALQRLLRATAPGAGSFAAPRIPSAVSSHEPRQPLKWYRSACRNSSLYRELMVV